MGGVKTKFRLWPRWAALLPGCVAAGVLVSACSAEFPEERAIDRYFSSNLPARHVARCIRTAWAAHSEGVTISRHWAYTVRMVETQGLIAEAVVNPQEKATSIKVSSIYFQRLEVLAPLARRCAGA